MNNGAAFDPRYHNASDFCGLTAAERAQLAEDGFSFEALPVKRFHDKHEHLPWFYRDVELLGYVFAVTDGGKPVDPSDVLRHAREAFGADVSVMWP